MLIIRIVHHSKILAVKRISDFILIFAWLLR